MTDANQIAGQWDRARRVMEADGLEALFVTEKFNYWLLTGHRSNQFDGKQRPMLLVLPLKGEATMIIYGRDEREVRATTPVKNIKTYVDVPFPLELVPQTFKELGLERARIGCEIGEFQRLGISYNDFMAIQRAMPAAGFVDASGIFNHLRMVKAPWEVERIRRACTMATQAWESTLRRLKTGMTADQVSIALQRAMLDVEGEGGHITLGLEGHGFVHTYAPGDWLWCDFGTEYEGYRSDLARMAVFGTPNDEQRREFDRIWELTRRLIAHIGPGITCSEVARRHSEDLVSLGLKPLEGSKRVGHGIGVTSDPPSLGLEDDTVLEPGMIVTPEPRYFERSGQRMHLEENVVVTTNGCELLSSGAERLVVIGG